jgi:uncharacterized protein
MAVPKSRNVLGGDIETCSISPMTGWFRDGCCNMDENDIGEHAICVQVTEEFLNFSKAKGNDLSTPRPNFQGLKPGDRWCVCAKRWLEAYQAGVAPTVVLASTHERMLDYISLEDLRRLQVKAN